MKNKVTVTRASRLRTCNFENLDSGEFYVADMLNSVDMEYSIFRKGSSEPLGPRFELPYELALGPDDVATFDSFDDMCKWVANGKRLEDLCSHTKELVEARFLPVGLPAEIMGDYRTGEFVTRTTDDTLQCIGDAEGYWRNAATNAGGLIKVWPLGAGDTITIEITE